MHPVDGRAQGMSIETTAGSAESMTQDDESIEAPGILDEDNGRISGIPPYLDEGNTQL